MVSFSGPGSLFVVISFLVLIWELWEPDQNQSCVLRTDWTRAVVRSLQVLVQDLRY